MRRRCSVRELHEDERGTTLMELIVGMSIMVMFMGMFTGAMLLMSNTTNKVEAITTSTGQLNDAFLRLDKALRYASGISPVTAATATTDWHVEFDRSVSTKTGTATFANVDTCTQLRVDQGVLQWRTWQPGSDGTSYSNLTGWIALASNVSNSAVGASPAPFSDPHASATATTASTPFQQLTVSLVVGSGTNTAGASQSSMTFTALNSNLASTAAVCQQVAVSS